MRSNTSAHRNILSDRRGDIRTNTQMARRIYCSPQRPKATFQLPLRVGKYMLIVSTNGIINIGRSGPRRETARPLSKILARKKGETLEGRPLHLMVAASFERYA